MGTNGDSDTFDEVRTKDLDRLEAVTHTTATDVRDISKQLYELRIALAERYVTKSEMNDAIQKAQSIESHAMQEIVDSLKEHFASDDKRFIKAERMLWTVIAGEGTALVGLIYVLLTHSVFRG